MTYHQMYRRTTLGNTLQEALDEMVEHKLLQQKTALKVNATRNDEAYFPCLQVIQKFDQCISLALAKRVKNRLSLKGHLNTYRFCDNVWTLVMNDVEIKDSSAIMTVDKIKIVACEGKSAKPTSASNVSKTPTSANPERQADAAPVDEEKHTSYLSDDDSD
ncbi:transcription initiation factor TFIIA small subunit [Clonorchis sinensis]|uniref:Transcription initiation factor TFIIA small subunit n=1 Tax=Clonorchis sinensis TaxID=79923 RepID=G7YL49_CLOSI|nr:transcription initiation factor TFIIA small subunit [Clonorchis sinensis]